MAIEKKENQIKKYNLTSPAQVVIVAKLVKNYIVENKLFAEIAGKNYVMVEGWQFAGGLLGFYPRVVEVKELSDNRWLAHTNCFCKIIKT